jgi:hypothetical protein
MQNNGIIAIAIMTLISIAMILSSSVIFYDFTAMSKSVW